MRGERVFFVAAAAFSLAGATLIVVAFVNPVNGFLSVVATLCFLVALAFYIVVYRQLRGHRSR